MNHSHIITELAEKMFHNGNECIIFVGAGLSRSLHYPLGFTMLERLAYLAFSSSRIGGKTKSRIKKYIKNKNWYDLLAEMDQIRQFCEDRYLVELRNMFYPKESTPKFLKTHSTLISLLNTCLKGIITTNFDLCLELAKDAGGFRSISSTTDITQFMENGKKYVFHIHRTIEEPTRCIVCRSHYSELYTTDFQSKLAHIVSNHTLLYIGTSLHDSELDRILTQRASIYIPANKDKFPHAKDHYAFIPKRRDIDPLEDKDTMYGKYKIKAEYYDVKPSGERDDYGAIDDHQLLYDMINDLSEEYEKHKLVSHVTEDTKPVNEARV